MKAYSQFLETKRIQAQEAGFDVSVKKINKQAFPFQADIVRWALRRGRAAIWAGTGLGKTLMQLEWAHHVHEKTEGEILLLCPLAVAEQTSKEASKFHIPDVAISRTGKVASHITAANYEMLHKFKPNDFKAIVLDESSVLKGLDGKTRKQITEFTQKIHYRLSCTATPAPNDYMEIGTQAEFLGVMSRAEMLATYFVHDGGETSKWRLKKHAVEPFWEWVASWAVVVTKPSDLGYEDGDFILPPLQMHQHEVTTKQATSGRLFAIEAKTMDERRKARRTSLSDRVKVCADLVNASKESWVVWCDLNAESAALTKAIDGAVEVSGSDSMEVKIERISGFASGKYRVLVTKPSICGWGLNWQHCANMAFVGLSDSFEQLYQAIRRCWRFGQKHPVNVHIITSQLEGAVVRNIERKEKQYNEMIAGMVKYMKRINQQNIKGLSKEEEKYATTVKKGKGWEMHLGDSCEVLAKIPSNSVHYIIFSPPFSHLYVYNNTVRDVGNSRNYDEFFEHYRFILQHLHRILMPGRLLSFHCFQIPKTKERDGEIGLIDFRGDLIREHCKDGMIYHSEVLIRKDPVVSMQRTKAIGLLHKQVTKDSTRSRQVVCDYLVTMMKPGTNLEPVNGKFEHYIGENDEPKFSKDARGSYSIGVWQRYAEGVWMDINQSETLQHRSARDQDDERHIAPLQLQVIERALDLWTNEGDLVCSPFAGIGSEGYVSLQQNRRFIGVELKKSYFDQACKNLESASKVKHRKLF